MTDWSYIDNSMLDPAWYGTTEYHEVFKKLRDEDPVHYTRDERFGKNYWALTRYEDVNNYLLNDQQLSSRWNSRVPRTPNRVTPEEQHALGWDVNVASLDDPLHSLYRRPMNKHFSVPAMKKLGSFISDISDEIIRDVADREEFDLVHDFAAELPAKVIFRLLGVPTSDWAYLTEASWQMLAASDPQYMIDGDQYKTMVIGMTKLLDYGEVLTKERRINPKDDLATSIVNTEMDGGKLSLHECRQWFLNIIAAGIETTRNAAAVGIWQFLENTEQRDLLLDNPSHTNSAIEEVLRWVSPAKNRLRIANEDIEIGGKEIHAGDWVVGFLASANKDERKFQDPYRFDITRTPNEHLSLGTGIHLCLGRALARLELATFIPKALKAFPDLERSDNLPIAWIQDTSVTGFTKMPMQFSKELVAQ